MINYDIITSISITDKSKVYLAIVDEYEQPVIVKILQGANKSIYDKIQQIDNVHIPKIYEIYEDNQSIILVEEYIEGETLDELTSKSISEKEALKFANQICEGLIALHNCEPPIIHRDIKPRNILVTSKGLIKITDFDASREYKDYSNEDTRKLGSADYAPPEQFGFSQTDIRSDIYAFGVVFYEILYGRKFHKKKAETDIDTYFVIMKNNKDADKIIRKCTMFSPEDRYQSLEEVKKCIEGLLVEHRKIKRILKGISIFLVFLLIVIIFYIKNDNQTTLQEQSVNYVTFHTDVKNDEGTSENLVVSYMKNKDIEDDFAIHHFLLESGTIDKLLYGADGDTVDIEIDDSYYYWKDGVLWIKAEFMNTLETKRYIFGVCLDLKKYILEVDIVDEESELTKKQPVLSVSENYYYTSLENNVTEYLYNAGNVTILKLYVDNKEVSESLYDILDNGRILRIKHEYFINHNIGDVQEFQAELSNGTLGLIYIGIKEKPAIYPVLNETYFIFHKENPNNIVISIIYYDYKTVLGLYGTRGTELIDEMYYTVDEKGIVIYKEFFANLEKGVYHWIVEFGEIGRLITITVD